MKIENNENNETVENESYRNPSPPPLTDAEKESVTGDLIGNTIFSQRWVLDVLLKLYKHEEDTIYTSLVENIKNEEKEQGSEHTSDNNERFLKDDFENDLCQLWDMTANSEVALFITEHDSKNILLDALRQTQSPRLMEICFGILGNLFCVKEIGSSLSQDGEMRCEILSYLTVMDALSLVELTRLLCTCLSCHSTLLLWVNDCCQGKNLEHLLYLLNNTLNVTLLCHVVKNLEIIFDECEDPLDSFITSEFIDGVIESFDSLNEKGDRVEYLVSMIYLLQILTTNNKGNEIISNKKETLLHLFSKYYHLADVKGGCEMTESNRLTIYASILSILDSLVSEHKEIVSEKNRKFVQQSVEYFSRYITDELQDENTNEFQVVVLCFEHLASLLTKLESGVLNLYKEAVDKLMNAIKSSKFASTFLGYFTKPVLLVEFQS
ncbi:protein saal1-like [Clytia hemisphaerica]